MKKGLRIAIIAAAVCLLAAAIFTIVRLGGEKRRQLTCGGVRVNPLCARPEVQLLLLGKP